MRSAPDNFEMGMKMYIAWKDHIESNPNILWGRPRIKGTLSLNRRLDFFDRRIRICFAKLLEIDPSASLGMTVARLSFRVERSVTEESVKRPSRSDINFGFLSLYLA
ncbi:MAG: hypothetical protein A2Z25_05050 [Planctomycetes bacterium RBG_16_55_9]|nr:MAG: hypothetical protein A2Z25_05050 [Planctomycetes bacterium RBG_16_55_9]